jgi:hypothetical protein
LQELSRKKNLPALPKTLTILKRLLKNIQGMIFFLVFALDKTKMKKSKISKIKNIPDIRQV